MAAIKKNFPIKLIFNKTNIQLFSNFNNFVTWPTWKISFIQEVEMSDDATSDDSDAFSDEEDCDNRSLASQLANAGPTGVAAAAAISSTK